MEEQRDQHNRDSLEVMWCLPWCKNLIASKKKKKNKKESVETSDKNNNLKQKKELQLEQLLHEPHFA